jgi:hypothetical protein
MADGEVVQLDADNMAIAVGGLRDHLESVTEQTYFEVPDLNHGGATDTLYAASALVAALPAAIAGQFEAIARTVLTVTLNTVSADAMETCSTTESQFYRDTGQ